MTGDTTVGNDTLISVEGVRGTAFVDTYNAVGFTGSLGAFNEFTGGGGDDQITGNGATRLGYNNATAGITFDINLGTTVGDGSVGTDHFTGVNAVQATMFDDFLYGGATNDTFAGLAGNDWIDGRGGFDTATYYNVYFVTSGVGINMTTGVVTGDASTGTDTLRSIEGIQGTTFVDTYDATNFGAVGFTDPSQYNVGNNGTFNQFEGMGGNDQITGNNNTRLLYTNATAGVTVTFSSNFAGSAVGQDASVGTDTFTGVNSITGSGFDDNITTGGGSDTITGGGGNDTINGGNGADMAIYSAAFGGYTVNFSTPAVGQTQVIDNTAGRDGTDALTSIEVLSFTDRYVMAMAGSSASPINVSGLGFGGNTNTFFGTNNVNGDFLVIGTGLSGHTINMQGGGTDTVILAGAGNYAIGLLNTEVLTGSTGNDTVNLSTTLSGMSVDLGAGTDVLSLAGGINSLTVNNVETITTADFSGAASNDTLTLVNNASGGMIVNLQQGNNTLNLAAGSNTFVDIYNVQHVNGTTSDDTLTLTDGIYEPGQNPIVDLGAGHDVLSFGSQFETLSAVNIEQINGNGLDNSLTLNLNVNGITVDLGAGNDTLSLATGFNAVNAVNVENILSTDFGATASNDTLNLLSTVSGVGDQPGAGRQHPESVGRGQLGHQPVQYRPPQRLGVRRYPDRDPADLRHHLRHGGGERHPQFHQQRQQCHGRQRGDGQRQREQRLHHHRQHHRHHHGYRRARIRQHHRQRVGG